MLFCAIARSIACTVMMRLMAGYSSSFAKTLMRSHSWISRRLHNAASNFYISAPYYEPRSLSPGGSRDRVSSRACDVDGGREAKYTVMLYVAAVLGV